MRAQPWLATAVTGDGHPVPVLPGKLASSASTGTLRLPPPTVATRRRTDGVMAWPCGVENPGPRAEHVGVESSHLGLGLNALA